MLPVDDRGREVSRLLEGRYEVLGLLGKGGFAAVYQVRNLRLQRLEAMKVVEGSHEENSEFLRRFEQESRVAASLEHPNILKVYDFGHVGGTLWYSMPFVDGPTLTVELRNRGTFEEVAAARIVVPLLDALEYSHGRGVIHRDIKLDNILLDRRDRPYLMDFGIAKTDDSLVKTQTGFVLGSPAYISPEQLRGDRLDGRTDVYSLGVSLFQMVSGGVPFKSDRIADLANRLVMDAPRLASRLPGVSPELDRIVARALARQRDERYPGAREMRQDLEAFLDSRRATPPALPRSDADATFLEDTAAVPALTVPPIAPPLPPPPEAAPTPRPSRRVSAVVAVPASPPPAPPLPAVPAPSPAARARAAVIAFAVVGGLLAVAGVYLLTRPKTRPAPDAAPLRHADGSGCGRHPGSPDGASLGSDAGRAPDAGSSRDAGFPRAAVPRPDPRPARDASPARGTGVPADGRPRAHEGRRGPADGGGAARRRQADAGAGGRPPARPAHRDAAGRRRGRDGRALSGAAAFLRRAGGRRFRGRRRGRFPEDEARDLLGLAGLRRARPRGARALPLPPRPRRPGSPRRGAFRIHRTVLGLHA